MDFFDSRPATGRPTTAKEREKVGTQAFGRVLFVEADRGALVYSSGDDGQLDRRLFFSADSSHQLLAAGSLVTFEFANDLQRLVAVDVRSTVLPETGIIIAFDQQTSGRPDLNKTLGQIQSNDGRVFYFNLGGVIPDSIGRFYMPPGTPVRFRIVDRKGSMFAVDVENIPTEEVIDLESFEEDGSISSLRTDRGFGFIRRPNHETSYFALNDIITSGLETLRIGSWVRYKPRRVFYKSQDVAGHRLWCFRCRLHDVQIYVADDFVETPLT